MSAKEQIGRLQALLERVQTRAAMPRTNGAAYAEPLAAAPLTPNVQAAAQDHSVTYESEAPPTDNYDYESDVEVSSEVVEVDIDIDEPTPLESGAQPVAHATMPPEDLVEELEEPPSATQPSRRPGAHEAEDVTQSSMASPPANEIEEPAPSSSRRPIAGEEPAAEAYEEESAPRHTPPPESGKQVAAPSVHPPPRKSNTMPPASAPPPSLEGHTLIGGWREPGLGTPQISPTAGLTTGVRVPPPPGAFAGAAPSGGHATEPPPVTVSQPQTAQGSGTRLTADVTRPELAASADVASFQGAAPVARPTTLGELLDLTLSL